MLYQSNDCYSGDTGRSARINFRNVVSSVTATSCSCMSPLSARTARDDQLLLEHGKSLGWAGDKQVRPDLVVGSSSNEIAHQELASLTGPCHAPSDSHLPSTMDQHLATGGALPQWYRPLPPQSGRMGSSKAEPNYLRRRDSNSSIKRYSASSWVAVAPVPSSSSIRWRTR